MYFVTVVIKILIIVRNVVILVWGNLITHVSVAVLLDTERSKGVLNSTGHSR